MVNMTTWQGILRMVRYAKREWVLLALALATMAGYAAGEGAYLAIAGPFLNAFKHWMKGRVGESDVDPAKLYYYGKLALALAPAVGILAFLQSYFEGSLVWRLSVAIRNDICRAIMPQSLSFFESRRSGDLMSRITNDVVRTRSSFLLIFSDIPQQSFHLLMGLSLALYANWRLLLICAISVPLVILPTFYLARRIRKYGKKGLEKLSDLTDQMSQMFSGIRLIKAYRMEQAEIEEFERVNDQVLRRMIKVVATRGMSVGVIELMIRLFMGAGILLGAWLVVGKQMDIELGNMVICLGGMYYAFSALRKLLKGYTHLQEAVAATDRIFEIIDHVPAVQDAADAVALPPVTRGVTFKNVSFRYTPDSEIVLQDVSCEVRKGQTVALVGRSGAGKSTFINLLCRFYDVSEGAVEIDGLDVRRLQRDSLLDKFAIVTQQTYLFNRTIADNIRYGKVDASIEEVQEAARKANIHDFIMGLPNGYETSCGEFGAKLSGGQRQRIAIARAMLKNADILILDEAMVGLDAESEALVAEAMRALMQGRTTFVITHDLPTIQSADLILVLRDGKLLQQGKHADLVAAEGEYRSLYALQFAGIASPDNNQAIQRMQEY